MLDAQLDAVYSAMERLGYHNIPILISETGWPSGGNASELAVSPAYAQTYNLNLIKYITANKGTPLRPGALVDAYIFGACAFHHNLKFSNPSCMVFLPLVLCLLLVQIRLLLFSISYRTLGMHYCTETITLPHRDFCNLCTSPHCHVMQSHCV